jgi:hypothetical protein
LFALFFDLLCAAKHPHSTAQQILIPIRQYCTALLCKKIVFVWIIGRHCGRYCEVPQRELICKHFWGWGGMTHLQAFLLGMLSAWVPSLAMVSLLFWHAHICSGHGFFSNTVHDAVLKIIKGGRKTD